jgi:hypothetical protein
LRFNFVIAAPKGPHSSGFARLASGASYEIINYGDLAKYRHSRVQRGYNFLKRLDSGFRRNDEKESFLASYETTVPKLVIANEAKQSYTSVISGDCFVATLLAMTPLRTLCAIINSNLYNLWMSLIQIGYSPYFWR